MRELLSTSGVLPPLGMAGSEKGELRFAVMHRYVALGSHPSVGAASLRIMGMWWQITGWMDDLFDPLAYPSKAEGERAVQGLLDGFLKIFLSDNPEAITAPSDDPHWQLVRVFSSQFSQVYRGPMAREMLCDSLRSWCATAGEVPDLSLGVQRYMDFRRREVDFDSIAAIELARCGLCMPREEREARLGRLLDLFSRWHGAYNNTWSFHRDVARGRADDSSNLLAIILRLQASEGSGVLGIRDPRREMVAAVDTAAALLWKYEEEFDAEAVTLCSDPEATGLHSAEAVHGFVSALRHWMAGAQHVIATDTSDRYRNPLQLAEIVNGKAPPAGAPP